VSTPYEPGQRVAYLEPDVEGVRVRDATVYGVEGQRVMVMIQRGQESEMHEVVVNEQRVATQLVPMDELIAAELDHEGDGYLVRPTQRDIYDVSENAEEAVQQMQVRWERAQQQNQGYGYLCCATPSLRVTTAVAA